MKVFGSLCILKVASNEPNPEPTTQPLALSKVLIIVDYISLILVLLNYVYYHYNYFLLIYLNSPLRATRVSHP